MNLGEILKTLRLDAGLTQKELAKKLDIGQSTIVGYERDGREATITNLSRYADYFDVTVDYLIGRTDDFGARTAAPIGESLTKAERELIEDFRRLSPYLQDIAKNTVRGLTGAGASDLQKKA